MADSKREMMILIVGAAGRIGRRLESDLERAFPYRVAAATREELDLSDRDRLLMELERLDPRPTVVINCAAVTEPEAADRAPDLVLGANRDGPRTLAGACRELGCRMLHFSTVAVFDGRQREPYREDHLPVPATQYGRIRYLGELAVAEANPDHLIIRLSLLCGDSEPGDPVRAIREAVESGTSLCWDDRAVSPLFAADLGSLLVPILRANHRGVLHVANGGVCFLSDLVEETARRLGQRPEPSLLGGPGPGSFRESDGPNGALDIRQYSALTGRRPRDWREALGAALAGEGKR